MSYVVRARPVARYVASRLPSSWPTRRALQLVLGTVWLLDAALQFQPYMFSSDFVTKTIEPTAAGDPGVIAGPVLWAAHVIAHHVALYNAVFATIQLMIAAGFFVRRTVRLALAASMVWAVFVWWFGEGLGGILTGGSPLAGAPGAVLLYALIALLLWPAPEHDGAAALAPALRGPLGPVLPRLAWLILWCGFGWYLLLPANRAPNAVSGVFAAAAAGQPGGMSSLGNGLASITAGHGLAASIVIWVLCDLVGLAIFAGRLVRPALILACLLGLLFWVAEGFGGLATGQATDPNSGPLLILLAACFWPSAHGGETPAMAGLSRLVLDFLDRRHSYFDPVNTVPGMPEI
jgi:hypothetical protein